MDMDELIVLTNLLVAITSIMAAAATEHDVVKTMGKTMMCLITGKNNEHHKHERQEK